MDFDLSSRINNSLPFNQWRFPSLLEELLKLKKLLTAFLENMDDKQISSLSVTQWNIKGLHDPIFGCKLQSADFLNSLTKYDINI